MTLFSARSRSATGVCRSTRVHTPRQRADRRPIETCSVEELDDQGSSRSDRHHAVGRGVEAEPAERVEDADNQHVPLVDLAAQDARALEVAACGVKGLGCGRRSSGSHRSIDAVAVEGIPGEHGAHAGADAVPRQLELVTRRNQCWE